MSGKVAENRPSDSTKTILAILIAISTIFGAFFAWRASVASGGASSADEAGLTAVSNSLEISNLTKSTVYQHLQGYVRYLAERGLSESLSAEASRIFDQFIASNGDFADPEAEVQIELLQEQLTDRSHEAQDRAAMSQYFLNTDYLQQDGAYNSEREAGESVAEASRYRDVDPEPHFARADMLRAKTSNLILSLLVFAFAVLTFVIAQALKGRAQIIALGVGLAVLALGSSMAAWIEWFAT